jgi:hypothetical protein
MGDIDKGGAKYSFPQKNQKYEEEFKRKSCKGNEKMHTTEGQHKKDSDPT